MKKIAFVRYKNGIQGEFEILDFAISFEKNGIEVIDLEISNEEDIRSAQFQDVDALYAACDPKLNAFEEAIIELSESRNLPLFSCANSFARKGGLFYVGIDYRVIGRQNGAKAAQILHGAKPSSLKTDVAANEYIIVNLDTARQLGITVPKELLYTANEVIGDSS